VNVKVADRVKAAVSLAAGLIMVYALFVSADHITYVAHLMNLHGYQARTLFVFIDLPALIGKLLRLRYFSASTRRMGLKLMIFSGTLSLVCNVGSGWFEGGTGPASYGVFIVTMFLVLENVVTRIKPAAAVTKAKNAVVTQTPARRRNVAKAAPRVRAPRVPVTAPVSPGIVPLAELNAGMAER
jgi:hypothetical protein